MCHFKKIMNNEDGYVGKCNYCKHFHIAFGTNILAFTYDQFVMFHKEIEEHYEHNKGTDTPGLRMVQIPTPLRSMMLLYSVNELGKLLALLQKSIECIANEDLLVFNEN